MLVDRIALAERLSFFCRKAIQRSGGKLAMSMRSAGARFFKAPSSTLALQTMFSKVGMVF